MMASWYTRDIPALVNWTFSSSHNDQQCSTLLLFIFKNMHFKSLIEQKEYVPTLGLANLVCSPFRVSCEILSWCFSVHYSSVCSTARVASMCMYRADDPWLRSQAKAALWALVYVLFNKFIILRHPNYIIGYRFELQHHYSRRTTN